MLPERPIEEEEKEEDGINIQTKERFYEQTTTFLPAKKQSPPKLLLFAGRRDHYKDRRNNAGVSVPEEEPTGERTTETGEEHERAVAGDFRRYWEEDGSEDPIPSRSRPLDDDCWPWGAHA
ncbi:hypothetical protein NDU88_004108 [Pleurodeles waltl]|uniref:Uncharacterized protein n=1 Tax=Pleurodeles waltl TaxID=8319 RepID=A0AAV7TRI7_PLEWA|nr:hypothetical protein NDU88_004108 [Pleurodeles waltl]